MDPNTLKQVFAELEAHVEKLNQRVEESKSASECVDLLAEGTKLLETLVTLGRLTMTSEERAAAERYEEQVAKPDSAFFAQELLDVYEKHGALAMIRAAQAVFADVRADLEKKKRD